MVFEKEDSANIVAEHSTCSPAQQLDKHLILKNLIEHMKSRLVASSVMNLSTIFLYQSISRSNWIEIQRIELFY